MPHGLSESDLAGRLDRFAIETPSWGYADTGTRFGKFLQAAAAGTVEEKFADAGQVHRLTGCCPTVALHVLWDFPFDEAGRLEAAAGDDPELSFLKAKYRAAFRVAVERAIAELEDKDALVLRQHFVDGLSIDVLGGLHQVHRATAARWVAKAQAALLAKVRDRFMAEANVGDDECQSVLRLVESRMDVTLRRHLVARAPG